MPIVIGLIVLIVAGAVTLTVIGLRNPEEANERALLARLEEFTSSGQEVDLRTLELSQPFSQRVVFPIARKLGELAVRFTPQNAMNSISRKLELAGSPASLDPTIILAAQFLGAALFGGAVFFMLRFGSLNWPWGRVLIMTIVFTLLGFYFPQLWLTSKIQKRQKEVRKAMPDALDLLTICVEAGLGFDAAMVKVSEKWQT
jgi:tight adherence protein C